MHKFQDTNIPFLSSLSNLSKVGILTAMLGLSAGLSGCQTIKSFVGDSDKEAIKTAEESAQSYYNNASADITKGNFASAIQRLKDLRTFYPTSQYAQQALLDLMYAQYAHGDFEDAAASANQFIRLYPTNSQADYAYYVRGVANMAGSSETLRIFKTNEAERDTAIYRLAFANFSELLNKHPNSVYVPDAAQRITYIYNQLAEHELHVARWYIKRQAYVAAANRAKWIFQYYPQSESTPEAIATLAYCYDKLGITDLANEYKTLLQINYPQWLASDGSVKLSTKNSRSLVNKLSFGKLGKSTEPNTYNAGQYNGQTKTQLIKQARNLRLPRNQSRP